MTIRKRGDRRGLNPRQPEPQSSELQEIPNTCGPKQVAGHRVKSGGYVRSRTGSRFDSVGQAVMPHRPEEPESSVLEKILFALNIHGGVVAFRNNIGAVKKGARFIRYGVGGKGGTDIMAFVAVETFCVPVFIEVKRRKGVVEEHQEAFMARMRSYGATAGTARTVDEALALVDDARRSAIRVVAA